MSISAHAVEQRESLPLPEPVSPQSDYTEAKQLLSKRKWAEAVIVLRSVHRKSPEFAPGAIELARALVYSGRREEALSVLSQSAFHQKGARKNALVDRVHVISRLFLTTKTHHVYQEGLNLLEARKYKPARELFERALEAEPDNVEVLMRIGQCLVLEGDYDSAAERLRLAKRLDPFELEVNLWLGRALHQRGELPDALGELKGAYEGLERSERAPLWYADALVTSGARRAAVTVLEGDARTEPFHLPGMIYLAKLRIELFRDGEDSLWNARRDLQVALSRLPKYGTLETVRYESELGIELRESSAELKERVLVVLSQLDTRLAPDLTPSLPKARPNY